MRKTDDHSEDLDNNQSTLFHYKSTKGALKVFDTMTSGISYHLKSTSDLLKSDEVPFAEKVSGIASFLPIMMFYASIALVFAIPALFAKAVKSLSPETKMLSQSQRPDHIESFIRDSQQESDISFYSRQNSSFLGNIDDVLGSETYQGSLIKNRENSEKAQPEAGKSR